MALRLAVILCHARRDPDLKGLAIQSDDDAHRVTLATRGDWATAYPQSAHLLREEMVAWQKTPWTLALA
jgi:exopolyphosphatase/guanosine-5'-triphosphate,3'-diphosphate pyrophosphatase